MLPARNKTAKGRESCSGKREGWYIARSVSLLETVQVGCPYCGEGIELVIDCSIRRQEYVEDCHVCCKPISLSVSINHEGEPSIEARREDE